MKEAALPNNIPRRANAEFDLHFGATKARSRRRETSLPTKFFTTSSAS